MTLSLVPVRIGNQVRGVTAGAKQALGGGPVSMLAKGGCELSMITGGIVLMTDLSSTEGSRAHLAAAVELLTGARPMLIDARHFMTGGSGKATVARGKLTMQVSAEEPIVAPAVVLIYEIPPAQRRQFEAFQRTLQQSTVVCLGTDVDGWRNATEKNRTVQTFLRDGIPHMATISLCRPSDQAAVDAFERLGGDVWARPAIGLGGNDVFHITTYEQLREAASHYARVGMDWLVARDALNFDREGRRHQFRVVVLHDQVLRVCEHVQTNPDAPCNETRGAVSTVLPIEEVPHGVLQLAAAACGSLGLPFGGVDLAIEGGGVVFEVNVHPVIAEDRGFETVAIPYVESHLRAVRARSCQPKEKGG